ncbi:fumarylacetoacetate hydrolase family protein [Pedobacter metabolipauper]|uniref:2-keto-4-pentenoate hydratase/2-oxohepta-3-ene-1,7-dioic acid hydratase in catechol pathway n=1 Tax=Pedobacter metabolipauper TaxID=425513 RepID=A0A4V3D1H5_9SPHI|nr:fumarylacetoacetate hydrolase family protein [Pedobacter metabolipauper]TDQ11213.1 2-keto-4-pentenoate hydratase/2-oxohepta-3-ene-1,7-dioic acid hydratase in catechol pathway [Pedobacter metabolipauper]
MNRILIGLLIGSLLLILDFYPAHSRFLPSLEILKNRKQLPKTITGRIAETTVPKNTLQILKSPEEALTLSRFAKGGQVHTLAVLEDDGKNVTGVDLSSELKRYDQNSFEVIKNLGFDDVVKLIRTSTKKVTVKYQDLLPGVAGDKHLAIGINYAEHGKETGQVKPFMFPKYVSTDPAIHQLTYTKGWLLDHEVELGIVFPEAVCSTADLNHMLIGFLVVNDFTDRATLMRKMDSQNVTGGRGFPDAKSKKGFLPTGPYLVVPRNWRKFIKELKLKLSVNGSVRQNGSAKDMVWDLDKIVERSLSVKGEKKSYYQGKMVKLFEGNCIPANSIIITGTPSGVVFNAPAKGFIFGAVTQYIFTGGFFSAKMHPYILQKYLEKEMTNPRYLKPGDEVKSSVNFLGTIKTSVKE